MYLKYSSSSGFPYKIRRWFGPAHTHSSNSPTVRGRVLSLMVLMTSTKGTSETTAVNSSGAILSMAPINKPPALAPMADKCLGEVYF